MQTSEKRWHVIGKRADNQYAKSHRIPSYGLAWGDVLWTADVSHDLDSRREQGTMRAWLSSRARVLKKKLFIGRVDVEKR